MRHSWRATIPQPSTDMYAAHISARALMPSSSYLLWPSFLIQSVRTLILAYWERIFRVSLRGEWERGVVSDGLSFSGVVISSLRFLLSLRCCCSFSRACACALRASCWHSARSWGVVLWLGRLWVVALSLVDWRVILHDCIMRGCIVGPSLVLCTRRGLEGLSAVLGARIFIILDMSGQEIWVMCCALCGRSYWLIILSASGKAVWHTKSWRILENIWIYVANWELFNW